jgi:O-antigen ligase
LSKYKGDYNVRLRLDLWEKGARMMMKYPLTGIGVGNYYRLSPYYSNSKSKWNLNENAHNYFIQFGAELGLPALLLLISLLTVVYRQAISEISIKSFTEPMLLSLLFGISAYLVTLGTSHHLLLSNQQILFWFSLSTLHVMATHDKRERNR